MIQFSWKPQGGTRDSPYRVQLSGGAPQMKITLNESASFNNLLSDHEYQISVDVSTCSKNVSTSLRVRTGIFSGTFYFSFFYISRLTHTYLEHTVSEAAYSKRRCKLLLKSICDSGSNCASYIKQHAGKSRVNARQVKGMPLAGTGVQGCLAVRHIIQGYGGPFPWHHLTACPLLPGTH